VAVGLFAHGHLRALTYDRRTIDNSLPMEEERRRSGITEKAKTSEPGLKFSTRSRDRLSAGGGH
jgi:hypothetical protein